MQDDSTLHDKIKFSLLYRAKSVTLHGKRKTPFSLQPVAYVVMVCPFLDFCKDDLVVASHHHVEHEVTDLTQNDARHDYGCCPAFNCEKVHGVVDEVCDAVLWDDADDFPL